MGKDYFANDNLGCPCGECVSPPMDREMMEALNEARHVAGVPFIVNSAYRCPEYNALPRVGGSPTSSHLKALAVDIRCANSPDRYAIVAGLMAAGFTRIGIYKSFVHADMDKSKTQSVTWLG